MGQDQLHALAFEQRYYAEDEATYNAFTRPTATGAFKALAVQIDQKRSTKPRRDNRATRSDYEKILGERAGKWSMKGYAIPSGAAGTAPDTDLIWRGAFGTRTVSGGVSVTYSPSSTQGDNGSFTLHRWSRVFMQGACGCGVDEIKFSVKGSDEPMMEASGFFGDYYETGVSILNGAMSSSTSMTVDDANNFGINSIVQVGANTNTGTGYRITAGTANPYTLEAALSASDDADVFPYAPTETVAGSPANGITGSFSIDGAGAGTIPWTGFEWTLKNNHKEIRYALNPNIQDYTEGWREVSGKFTLMLRRDQVIRLGNALRAPATTRALVLICGTTAGSIITSNFARARFEDPTVNFPEGADSGEVDIEFSAMASASTASDEVSVVFT